MARRETVVLTNLCMVYDDKGNILVEDRKDEHWSGIAFPGGHVEPGEPFVKSVIREVYEETGLTIASPKLCGIKQFTHYDGARCIVLLFKTNIFSGTVKSSDEGDVFWLQRSELANYRTVNDFDRLLEVFDRDDLNEFYYDRDFNITLL